MIILHRINENVGFEGVYNLGLGQKYGKTLSIFIQSFNKCNFTPMPTAFYHINELSNCIVLNQHMSAAQLCIWHR